MIELETYLKLIKIENIQIIVVSAKIIIYRMRS